MWLLKEPRQQIGTSTVALPAIPWHRRAGADSAAAGCVDAILRQTTQPLFVLLAATRGGKAGCQGTDSFQFLFCPGTREWDAERGGNTIWGINQLTS